MALACVRQRRGPSRSERGFCLIFKGFSLDYRRDPNKYHGRGTATRSGKKLPRTGSRGPWSTVTRSGKKLPRTGEKLPRFAIDKSGKTNHGPRFAVRLIRFKARGRGNANRD